MKGLKKKKICYFKKMIITYNFNLNLFEPTANLSPPPILHFLLRAGTNADLTTFVGAGKMYIMVNN